MSTKYAPFSPDEADDYNILVSDAEFYAINSSKISSALREKHRNVKECPLTTLSVSFREYAFHGVSKSTFVAGDYCFIEHVFHDLNATSEIIGAVFDIYYNDSYVLDQETKESLFSLNLMSVSMTPGSC